MQMYNSNNKNDVFAQFCSETHDISLKPYVAFLNHNQIYSFDDYHNNDDTYWKTHYCD